MDSVIVTIDLHGLDALNDAYGSATGDEALREFAQATRAAAPSTDITARIARHQFGVLLIRRGDRATPMFIGRLRDALAGRAAHLSVSVGHASLRRSSSPADALNRAALASLPAIRG